MGLKVREIPALSNAMIDEANYSQINQSIPIKSKITTNPFHLKYNDGPLSRPPSSGRVTH